MKIIDDMTFSGSPHARACLTERMDQSPQIGPSKHDQEAEQSHAMIRPSPDADHCLRTLVEPGLLDHSFGFWIVPPRKQIQHGGQECSFGQLGFPL